jgi:hypothetical protein
MFVNDGRVFSEKKGHPWVEFASVDQWLQTISQKSTHFIGHNCELTSKHRSIIRGYFENKQKRLQELRQQQRS